MYYKMEAVIVEPDFYTPSINELGNYVDKHPSLAVIERGLYCPCSVRKDMIYSTKARLSGHFKTKSHQSWLETINFNKANYYIENIKLRENEKTQKQLMGCLEKRVGQLAFENDSLLKKILELENINSHNKKIIEELFSGIDEKI